MKNIKIKLIYFTTESKNTLNFVSRLTDFESIRIPENGDLLIDTPYVLVFPSYGGGKDKGSVPAPVIKFIMKRVFYVWNSKYIWLSISYIDFTFYLCESRVQN